MRRNLDAAALIAISALAQLHPEHETDSSWHMMLAREVLATGSRVVAEPTAFETFGRAAIVPEWLWGTLNLAVYEIGGWEACSVLVVVCAAFAAYAALRMLRTLHPAASRPALLLVGGVLLAAMSQRLTLRPESAALIAAPAFIAICASYFSRPERAVSGLALLLTEILWAQLHGSFVLAPILFAVMAATSQRRAVDALVGAGLILGLGASAYGSGIVSYLLAHGVGDAKQHIVDMRASDWATFDPTRNVSGAMYLFLWVLSLPAMVRRRSWRLLLLALVSIPLVVTAGRFVSLGGILVAPLALDGAHRVLARRRMVLATLVTATVLGLSVLETAEHRGPIGTAGLSESGYPLAAAAELAELPEGSRALTSFDAGGPLGFWLGGRVRTYVDGRTPLFFNDTEFAISRHAFGDTKSLSLVARRFGVSAIVTPRAPTCPDVPDPAWIPVALDPIFTTYVKRGTPGVTALAALTPCGQDYIGDGACVEGALQRDIDRHEGRASAGFVAYLRAEQAVRCDGDIELSSRLVPGEHAAWYYRDQRNMLRARILLARKDPRAAIALLEPVIAKGNLTALRVVWNALDDIPDEDARALLLRCTASLDDATPSSVRARLAVHCLRLEDEACVRDQAFRAAAQGNTRIDGPLRWLADKGSTPELRAEAQDWLNALHGPPPPR